MHLAKILSNTWSARATSEFLASEVAAVEALRAGSGIWEPELWKLRDGCRRLTVTQSHRNIRRSESRAFPLGLGI